MNFELIGITFSRISNVTSASVTLDGMKRIIHIGSDMVIPEAPIFFVIDTLFDDAFGHWHAESAVFLRYWRDLILMFPSLVLLLEKDRIYKRLAVKAYNILPDKVVFGGSASLPEKNLCIFPPLILLNDRDINIPLFSNLWMTHVQYLHSAANVSALTPKTISTLALPRQTLENFKANDRVIPRTEELCRSVNEMDGGVVLHTDEVTDFLEQVRTVVSSQTIIVVYGSAFLVNGSLAINSYIKVISRIDQPYPGIDSILSWISSRGNTITYI